METSIPAKQKLWREITVTLVLKIILIYLLWWLFFSSPVDEHLTGSHVGNFLFGDVQQIPQEALPSSGLPLTSDASPDININKEN